MLKLSIGLNLFFLILFSVNHIVPEYSLIYKQGVKDTLSKQNKGRVSCELIIHDVREGEGK